MVSHLEQFQVPFFVHKSNSAASPLVELALGCFFSILEEHFYILPGTILCRGRQLWISRHFTCMAQVKSESLGDIDMKV